MSTHDLLTIVDAVDELTRPRTNREPFTKITDHGTMLHDRHITHVPALLEQLQEAITPSGSRSTESGVSVPTSRPSAQLEAMDTYNAIDQAVYVWVKTYAEQRRWDSLTDRLRALVGIAGNIEDDEQHQLARECRRWLTWAKVSTGWEVPARRPNNTCPLCGRRDTLRVRVGDGVTSNEASAVCIGCGETWDDTNIGLLAQHIRDENDDEPLLYGDGAA